MNERIATSLLVAIAHAPSSCNDPSMHKRQPEVDFWIAYVCPGGSPVHFKHSGASSCQWPLLHCWCVPSAVSVFSAVEVHRHDPWGTPRGRWHMAFGQVTLGAKEKEPWHLHQRSHSSDLEVHGSGTYDQASNEGVARLVGIQNCQTQQWDTGAAEGKHRQRSNVHSRVDAPGYLEWTGLCLDVCHVNQGAQIEHLWNVGRKLG